MRSMTVDVDSIIVTLRHERMVGRTSMVVKSVFFGMWNYKLDARGQRVQSYDKAVQVSLNLDEL